MLKAYHQHVKAMKKEEAESPYKVGNLVLYFYEGWRAGYIDSVKGKVCTIRPIAPRGGAQVRRIRIPLEDIRTT